MTVSFYKRPVFNGGLSNQIIRRVGLELRSMATTIFILGIGVAGYLVAIIF